MLRRTFLAAAGMAAASRRASYAASGAPLKIGQIGTSHAHAAGKMSEMRKFPALWEVVGLVEPEPRRLATSAKGTSYVGLPVMSEDQLLAVPELRAVAVETRIEDSCARALRVIKAGKHVH